MRRMAPRERASEREVSLIAYDRNGGKGGKFLILVSFT